MHHRFRLALICGLLILGHSARGEDGPQQEGDFSTLRAVIQASDRMVAVGKPIWLDFSIVNDSDRPVTLAAPGVRPERPGLLAGLPLTHVFSGHAFGGLTVESLDAKRVWDVPMDYEPEPSAPQVLLAPRSSVGVRVEITRFYPQLGTAGRYRLQWRPYDGALTSNAVVLEVAPRKQAIIQTDQGSMTVRFFYDEAPEAVANFLELARSGFYNGLTFHKLHPGIFIQGGDPTGDGTGIRPDGKKLMAELSERPQTRGTVSMATLRDDPDSASCQFFICNTRVKDWDGKYTIFGELEGDASFETLDKLMALPTLEGHQPKRPIVIRSIRVVNAPPEEPVGEAGTP